MESVIDRVALHVGDETGDIDDGHVDDTTLCDVSPDGLLELFHDVADSVADVLNDVADWSESGARDGQYHADLLADEAALDMLRLVPVGVLSEESGVEHLDREIVVIVDPLDGSTNASRGVPHYATSLCAVDADGPLVALVAHQALPIRWWAVRGGGAWCNDERFTTPTPEEWSAAIVGLSGPPPQNPGWWQYRALGASAIDLCLVADGTLDAFVDCSVDAHGVWDYAGAFLIGREAGIEIRDAKGRDLMVRDHGARRTPVAAHRSLIDRVLAVRSTLP